MMADPEKGRQAAAALRPLHGLLAKMPTAEILGPALLPDTLMLDSVSATLGTEPSGFVITPIKETEGEMAEKSLPRGSAFGNTFRK